MEHSQIMTPREVIAQRVKEARTRHGWSARELAKRCAEAGMPSLDRSALSKIEAGLRQRIGVEELLVLACVLDVALVHLLVPPLPSPKWDMDGGSETLPPERENDPNDMTTLYQVTPTLTVPLYRMRQFIRGMRQLPGMDARTFFSQVPPHEFAGVALEDLIAHKVRDELVDRPDSD